MSQTLNFRNRQEYENWANQNKGLSYSLNGQPMGQPSLPAPTQRQDKGFFGNLIGGIVDPFAGLLTKTVEAGRAAKNNKLNDFLTGSNNYEARVMSEEDYNKFKQNALLETGKDLAGVASWLVPGGAAAKGIGSLVKGGIVGGALGGFSASDKSDFSGLLNDAGTGALTGGAMAGGLGLGGKVLGNFSKGKIGKGLQDAGQSVKSSNLGYKPLNLADGTAGKVTQQLGEAGLPVTGANAQKLADSNSKAFRTTLTDSNKIVDFGGASQSLQDDITKVLEKDFGLGKNEIAGSKQIQNALQDKIDSILRTEGNPNKIMDEIGKLTTDKTLVGDITVANKNKVIEATRQVLKDKLQNAFPEAQEYFQKNQPLRAVAKDATKLAQNMDNVPVPFLNTQFKIPGVGNIKQGVTNLLGGGLENAGKFTDGLAGLLSGVKDKSGKLGQFLTIPNIARGINAGTGFGGIDTAQNQDMQDVNSMESGMDTMETPQAPESEYSQDEIRQAMMELTTPVRQGGRGFSPSEAQKFLQLAYGIGGNSQSSTAGGAKPTKITDSTKKFFAAGDLAQKALRSLESGKVGTGKLATVGNKFSEFFGSQSPEQTDYLSNVASARGAAISALSGANVPDSEYARIADLIPTSMDEPQIAKQKLKSFIAAMRVYGNPNPN